MSEHYDPMLYDVMKEAGCRLGGDSLARAREGVADKERACVVAMDAAVQAEVDSVDYRDEQAVHRKTAELGSRIRSLQ